MIKKCFGYWSIFSFITFWLIVVFTKIHSTGVSILLSTIRVHHMDAKKTCRGKARRGIHKNITCYTKKSWKQHSKKQQMFSHLAPISITIQLRRTRHEGHCWRSNDEIMWRSSIDLFTWTCQLCVDTGCRLEDLPGAMDDRDDLIAFDYYYYLILYLSYI